MFWRRWSDRRQLRETRELVRKLTDLMDTTPSALCGIGKLPASKEALKKAIQAIWPHEPEARNRLGQAYRYLSHFHEEIGDLMLECDFPKTEENEQSSLEEMRQELMDMVGPKSKNFRLWVKWSKVQKEDYAALSKEWDDFETAQGSASILNIKA